METLLWTHNIGTNVKLSGAILFITSRKAGQHVLLVQGTGGTFSFLETSVHVKPLENL